MAETIESFVAKLQDEGVQAGQAAAEKIREEAEQLAKQIVDEARQEAEKIVSEAKKKAEEQLHKGNTELQLAVRDAVLKLRSVMNLTLRAVLTGPVEPHLGDSDFIVQLLREIVTQYARSDSGQVKDLSINLPPEMSKELSGRTLNEIRRAAQSPDLRLDVKGELTRAGFEYRVAGGTVEITTESLVETLRELVSPLLAEYLEQAVSDSEG